LYTVAVGQSADEWPKSRSKKPSMPTMKTTQYFQKISAGVNLFILALGFLLIGLVSLIRTPLSGDSLASSAMSCSIGGWASVAVASAFLFAAFVYRRRFSWLAV
jgi:hypothetical protein